MYGVSSGLQITGLIYVRKLIMSERKFDLKCSDYHLGSSLIITLVNCLIVIKSIVDKSVGYY